MRRIMGALALLALLALSWSSATALSKEAAAAGASSPYAVSMEPMVPYSQRDPLYHSRLMLRAATQRRYAVVNPTAQRGAKNRRDAGAYGAPPPPAYDEYGPPGPPHHDYPEPIIEIIIKESNESLPAPPPPPVLAPKKPTREPVHVFYVKYKQTGSGEYGKDGNGGVVFDDPIPALTPAPPPEEEDDHHHHHQHEHTQLEDVTPLPPRQTTTLRAIIHPDSELAHAAHGSEGKLRVTFGGPHDDESSARAPQHGADDKHDKQDGHEEGESAQQPAVAFPAPSIRFPSDQQQDVQDGVHQIKRSQQQPAPHLQQTAFPPLGHPPAPAAGPQQGFGQQQQQHFQQGRFHQPPPEYPPYRGQNQFGPPPPPSGPLRGPPPPPQHQKPAYLRPQPTLDVLQNPRYPQSPQSPQGQQQGQQGQFQEPFRPRHPTPGDKPQRPPFQPPHDTFRPNYFPQSQSAPATPSRPPPFAPSTQHPSRPTFQHPPPPPPPPFPQQQQPQAHQVLREQHRQQVLLQQQQQQQALLRQQQQQQFGPQHSQHSQFPPHQQQQFAPHQPQPQQSQPQQHFASQQSQPQSHFAPQQPQTQQSQFVPQQSQTQQSQFAPQQPQTQQSQFVPQQSQTQNSQFSPQQPQTQQSQFVPQQSQTQQSQFAPQHSQTQQSQFAPQQPSQQQLYRQQEHQHRNQQQQALLQQQQQQQQQQFVPQQTQAQRTQQQQQRETVLGSEIIKSIPQSEEHVLLNQGQGPFGQGHTLSHQHPAQHQQQHQQQQHHQQQQPQQQQPHLNVQVLNSDQDGPRVTFSSSTPSAPSYEDDSEGFVTPSPQPAFSLTPSTTTVRATASPTPRPPPRPTTTTTEEPPPAPSSPTTQEPKIDLTKKLAQLPDEVPDDIREQLIASGILGNADIQILDYDKIGDTSIDSLPAHALENFYASGGAQASASEHRPVVVAPPPSLATRHRAPLAALPEPVDAEPSASEVDEVVQEPASAPQASNVEMKVVRFDPATAEGQQVADQYLNKDAAVLNDPVVLNDNRYNRYLPLKISGATFPLPDAPLLRGRNVTSVVVLAPVDYDFLQAADDGQGSSAADSDTGRVGRAVEVHGVRFVAGDALKKLVRTPTQENYRQWLQQERQKPLAKQSVILLVTSPTGDSDVADAQRDKEIFMYDPSSDEVSRLSGELSTSFVEVAESNALSQDLENVDVEADGEVADVKPEASNRQEVRVQAPEGFLQRRSDDEAHDGDLDGAASDPVSALFRTSPVAADAAADMPQVAISSGYARTALSS